MIRRVGPRPSTAPFPTVAPLPAAGHPLRFAHRGAAARAPENTIAAFEEAIRLGVDAIEMDVRLSADGVPVVMHDDRVDRRTDGRGSIRTMTLAEIKRLDAGSWFARRYRGERVPRLSEALECIRGRCGLNLEIKAWLSLGRLPLARRYMTREEFRPVAAAVAREIGASGFRGFLVISSFSRAALETLRAAMPRAPLGLVVRRSMRGLHPAHRDLGLCAVHPHVRLATPRRFRAAHGLGLAVFAWPVNDPTEMQRLTALGADGLMSSDPALFDALEHPLRARGTRS